MNLRILLAAAAAASALVATSAEAAATQQSAQANASATIVTPASLAATQDLAFGTIAKPTSGTNTVTVGATTGANITPTLGGGGNAYVATANQAHAAVFHLAGTANTAYTLDSAQLTFGSADSHLSPVAVVPSNGSLNSSGTADVPIGGTINISASTPATTYNGTLTLTATFQ
jgi:hypothetical protein